MANGTMLTAYEQRKRALKDRPWYEQKRVLEEEKRLGRSLYSFEEEALNPPGEPPGEAEFAEWGKFAAGGSPFFAQELRDWGQKVPSIAKGKAFDWSVFPTDPTLDPLTEQARIEKELAAGSFAQAAKHNLEPTFGADLRVSDTPLFTNKTDIENWVYSQGFVPYQWSDDEKTLRVAKIDRDTGQVADFFNLRLTSEPFMSDKNVQGQHLPRGVSPTMTGPEQATAASQGAETAQAEREAMAQHQYGMSWNELVTRAQQETETGGNIPYMTPEAAFGYDPNYYRNAVAMINSRVPETSYWYQPGWESGIRITGSERSLPSYQGAPWELPQGGSSLSLASRQAETRQPYVEPRMEIPVKMSTQNWSSLSMKQKKALKETIEANGTDFEDWLEQMFLQAERELMATQTPFVAGKTVSWASRR